MKKYQLLLLALSCTGVFAGATLHAKPARNPIIWADVPDPAVIRVGDTYYMSSTTMHMSPGLPIMKSRNLVNWHLVGYAYDTLADNDALTLQNGRNAYGAGSWAKAYFRYSLDGEEWTRIGKPLQMVYTLPHFMGYRFGLFNFATKTPGGFVDFDFFRVSDEITGAE